MGTCHLATMTAPAIVGGKARLRMRAGIGGKQDGGDQSNPVQCNHSRISALPHGRPEMGLSRDDSGTVDLNDEGIGPVLSRGAL